MKKFTVLWICFAVFFVDYVIRAIELWPMLALWVIGLSVYLLVKNGFPSVKGIVISLIFVLLDSIALLTTENGFGASVVVSGLLILVCSFAVISALEKQKQVFLLKTGVKPAIMSILLGLGIGICLGIINIFLGMRTEEFDVGFSAGRILFAVNPAVLEEICFRAVFLAFCGFGAEKLSKGQRFTMWFMMIMPHVLSHGEKLVESLVLALLFGLPFAILQKKRDIASAMIGHGVVDLIRFVLFGLPM